jgi:hypothetical protein
MLLAIIGTPVHVLFECLKVKVRWMSTSDRLFSVDLFGLISTARWWQDGTW